MARWEGIYEFTTVVDEGSFTSAAERLGVSNSQVSKLVARLEDRLGTRLLNRTTRRVTLTDEGEHFYERCKETINEFEQAEQSVISQQAIPHGRLRINLAGSFQERYIVPLLASFVEEYPRLSVDVVFTDAPVDVVAGGYDIALCEGALEDSSLIARRIAENYHFFCASPEYLDRHGRPEKPADLKDHNCLVGTERSWRFNNGEDSFDIRVTGNWHSPNGAALLAAASNGLGIARLPLFAITEELNNGTLVQVLESWSKVAVPVWVVYPHNRHLSAKVRKFVDFLCDFIEQDYSGDFQRYIQ